MHASRLHFSPRPELSRPTPALRWLRPWCAALLVCTWALPAAHAAPDRPADRVGQAAPAASAAPTDNPAPADTPACNLLWQIQVQLGTAPRSLLVDMAFDAGPRTRTNLRLPGGWAGVIETTAAAPTAPLPRLQAVVDMPTLRTVSHAAGERVQLRWRLTPPADAAQGGSVQLADTWFALVGQGVLPVPDELDERHPPTACVAFYGLTPRADDLAPVRWASSHGLAEGPTALFRVAPGAASLRSRVQQALYAGGALQTQTQSQSQSQSQSKSQSQSQSHTQTQTQTQPPTQAHSPDAGSLMLARPAGVAWRFSLDALGQAAGQALATQRQFWGDTGAAGPLLVLLLPNAPTGAGRGSAWHQALALQGPADLAVPGSAADALLTEALVRSWVPDRFGPLVHTGRGDAANRAWFSEGWAEFYTHRLLLRDGRWTPADYAAALNRKIERFLDASARAKPPARDAAPALANDRPGVLPAAEMAGARGEWLALQWHAALRAAGQPGLDATMRRLLVAPALARHEGLISAPLATHRLVAALRPALGDRPLRDITRQADRGEAPAFGPATLGPCFVGRRVASATWRLGLDPVSLSNGVVSGVEPGGPADAADLRDGMVLAGHLLVPGDPTQPVQLKVMDARPGASASASEIASANANANANASASATADSREIREIRYLPAGEPVRELPRYQPVADALQQPACLGWLGLGPDAATAQGVARGAPSAAATGAAATTRQGARTAGKPSHKSKAKSTGRATGKSTGKSTGTSNSTSTGKFGAKGTGTPAVKASSRTSGASPVKPAAKSGKPGSAVAQRVGTGRPTMTATVMTGA